MFEETNTPATEASHTIDHYGNGPPQIPGDLLQMGANDMRKNKALMSEMTIKKLQ
jgi:hypothetical protein